jgi:hypothetical protein
MRWVMRAKSSLIALSVAAWWILVNLPWLQVGQEEFTGGQLIPVLNLLPAIALTALFISIYGKLRRTLLIAAASVLTIGLYLSVSVDLSVSAVVVTELERLSGVLNPDSHQAGVTISDAWGKYAAIAANAVALLTALFGLRSNQQRAERKESGSANDDNRSLWDEQN